MENTIDQIFIIPLERELDDNESGRICSLLNLFLEKWNSHGNPLTSSVSIEESKFLIILNPDGQASGCSKDKLFKEINLVCSQLGIKQEQAGKFYIQLNGIITGLSRKELIQKQEDGEILPDAILFPTWISNSVEFEKCWKKPLNFFPNLLPKKDLV